MAWSGLRVIRYQTEMKLKRAKDAPITHYTAFCYIACVCPAWAGHTLSEALIKIAKLLIKFIKAKESVVNSRGCPVRKNELFHSGGKSLMHRSNVLKH